MPRILGFVGGPCDRAEVPFQEDPIRLSAWLSVSIAICLRPASTWLSISSDRPVASQNSRRVLKRVRISSEFVAVIRVPREALPDREAAAEVLGDTVEYRAPHLGPRQSPALIELPDELHPEIGELVRWRCAIGASLQGIEQKALVGVQSSERDLASPEVNVTVLLIHACVPLAPPLLLDALGELLRHQRIQAEAGPCRLFCQRPVHALVDAHVELAAVVLTGGERPAPARRPRYSSA